MLIDCTSRYLLTLHQDLHVSSVPSVSDFALLKNQRQFFAYEWYRVT